MVLWCYGGVCAGWGAGYEFDFRTEYAAKYIKKKRVETSRRGVAMGDIEKEIHILAEMENENIIYLHQVYENAQFVILIIEL